MAPPAKARPALWGMVVILSCAAATHAAAIRDCSESPNKLDDVYCIGQRRVAHHSFISIQKEVAIGKQYAAQIDRSAKILKDPVVTEYVNRIEQNLAENSDARMPITVQIIEAPQINAFTLPGGCIYVDTGLIEAVGNEAELAAVLAHETGHVAARHWASEQTKRSILECATIPLIFTPMSYPVYLGVSEGLNLGIPISFLKFSRDDEQQADFLGVQYLWKAGYDPNAFTAMFGKILEQRRQDPSDAPNVFLDHPPTPDRVIHAEEEIKTLLPKRRQYLVSTSEFQDVQNRLKEILGQMKRHQHNGPTLRQRTSQTGAPNDQPDKPPVLRRRD